MSDTSTQTGAEGAVEDAGAAAAAAADTGAETGADLFDNPETDQFPRSYVEKLRNEAAGYRTKASAYEEVFGNYSDEDRQVWLGMAKTLYQDPAAGAEWMAKVAEHVRAGLSPEAAAEQATAEQDAEQVGQDKPLTKAELDQWYRDQRAAEKAAEEQEALISSIETEAKQLGYEEGTPEYNNLLWYGANKTGGDLAKAHDLVQADKQAIVDQWVAQKQEEAKRAGLPDPTGVPTMGTERKIGNLKDAHEAAKARIAALAGAQR